MPQQIRGIMADGLARKAIREHTAQLAEKANIAQEAWITPTLLGAWVGDAGFPIAYYKDSFGIVHVRGAATGSEGGSSIFKFPIDYSPSTSRQFATTSNGANAKFARLLVKPDGTVTAVGEYMNGVSLDVVSFSTY